MCAFVGSLDEGFGSRMKVRRKVVIRGMEM